MAVNEESKNMQIGESAFAEDGEEPQTAEVTLQEEAAAQEKPTFKIMAKDIDTMADELMIDGALAKSLLVKSEGDLVKAVKFYIESY